ncbi:MAG: ParB N-terminal domain-containing protein, partial [Synergistaceae bacterium]|nr:ParB N-terminal domain-containing protein [Synergistaceae bacterium]
MSDAIKTKTPSLRFAPEPQAPRYPSPEAKPAKAAIYNIPLKNIFPNPNQPRKDFDEQSLHGLAQSIKDYGIIQPLCVRLISPAGNGSPPVYELISGERRLRAVRLLFWETVPCVLVNADKQA